MLACSQENGKLFWNLCGIHISISSWLSTYFDLAIHKIQFQVKVGDLFSVSMDQVIAADYWKVIIVLISVKP